MVKARSRPPGRPRAGLEPGEKASEYRRLMLRLPEDRFAELSAAARTIGQPFYKTTTDES